MKKAQVQQAFTVILFILISGFVVIIGYQFITGIGEGSCDAEKVQFRNKITNFFDQYDDYGAVQRESVNLPCSYSQVCFVDSGAYNDTIYFGGALSGQMNKRAVVETANSSRNNIFLIGEFAEPVGYSEKISVQEGSANVLCVESRGGQVDLVFEGKGQKTLVKEG